MRPKGSWIWFHIGKTYKCQAKGNAKNNGYQFFGWIKSEGSFVINREENMI